MATIKVAVVEDEQIQLALMERLIMQVAVQLSLTVELFMYSSGEALLFALEDSPQWDIVFLDIQMNGIYGMSVARQLRDVKVDTHIVFSTAYAEYAIEGYEVEALDYLLKPITAAKIDKAIQKYLKFKPKEEVFVVIEVAGKSRRLDVNQLVAIEASRNDLILYLVEDTVTVRMPLQQFMQQLDERFIMTHRSYAVNLDHVTQLLKQDVVLTGKRLIPISRRLVRNVQEAFVNHHKGQVFYGNHDTH